MKSFFLIAFAVMISCLVSCSHHPSTLFNKIASSHSNIHFNNTIVETDSINPMNVVNIYNGGGVGIGDFNGDGLADIYFTGNMVASKLYLNKGHFVFEDITEKAGATGEGRWARGVSVVDINNDGRLDLYVCNTIYKDSLRRQNILYINQGNDAAGIPQFKDMAVDYGLDIQVQSTMGSFFDYDNDGDLDMYLTVNEASNGYSSSTFRSRNSNTVHSTGRLYRNDMDSSLHHAVFHDVSEQAGVTLAGFGHAATICDLNNDGWKDIYVSDDFISSNILYINNQNGTFTDRSREYFKHTSFNSMGQDVVDINNDGLADVVELDMSPHDNHRKKMMSNANNYNTVQNFENFSYQVQYVRNTLQLNQGPRILEGDSLGAPVFAEIAFMSGVSQTDWSWTPLVTDFDNDGYRDMIITNGFPKDVSDHDFIAYRDKARGLEAPMRIMEKIPVIKIPNYAFKNTNGVFFKDVSREWGLPDPSFSNGAAYADLDNDGDLDMVINNVNDEAFVYENTLRKPADTAANYLQLSFVGDKININALGAFADIYYNGGKHQVYEHNPYRGYLSSNQLIAHFGLGDTRIIDSVIIRWPNKYKQVIRDVHANQLLKVKMADARPGIQAPVPPANVQPIFSEITKASAINLSHQDFDFIDFNIQTTLPHKFSQYAPALSAADLNGDGLDDIVMGGNNTYPPKILFQHTDGKFSQQFLLDTKKDDPGSNHKDEGILIFDANGDGYPDVYIASGGYNYPENNPAYQDRIYLNDGKGHFSTVTDGLPVNYTSKLCVRALDYNNDGKLDLFVSGRVVPGKYPRPTSCFLYRNDSENGHMKFTDVTATVAPGLQNIGMVCDALFTDFDNDNQADLILAGEWMPIQFYKYTDGVFRDVTASTGLSGKSGWWNAIVAGDFRHSGKMDYIIGNVGLNTLYQASDSFPVYMTAKDFDHNGSYVPIPSLYLPAVDGSLKEFPAFGRDDIVDRIPTLKKRFDNYGKFADADMEQIFTPEMRKDAQRLKATMLQSCYLRNEGGGRFTMIPLPAAAQVSTVNGMLTGDFDGDGNLDALLSGNDFGTEVSIGRLDAGNGLFLKGDGQGNFKPLSIAASGIYIPGDAKALVSLASPKNGLLIAASQNRGALKLFRLNTANKLIDLHAEDKSAIVQRSNGSKEKQEFYFGAGFMSQPARHLMIGPSTKTIKIVDAKGNTRTVQIQY